MTEENTGGTASGTILEGATTPPDGEVKPQDGQVTEAAAPEGEKPEGEKETEEVRKSRSARRLDRWRTRAIEAETRYKILQESQGRPQPAETERPAANDGAPQREQFASYEEFMEAKATHVASKAATEAAEKAIKAREESEKEAKTKEERDAQQRGWMKQVETARDDIEDFDEVCAESEAPVTAAMSQAIMESDKGARIAYYLAQHPDEAEKISKLTPTRQMAAIVGLEEKVGRGGKPASRAPDPITPVNGKAGADNLSTTDPRAAEKLSTAEWMRREEARMMAKAKAGLTH